MEPDQPAGYFSTFPLDPSRSPRETQSRPQKRNRRIFVCIPCHRRKLKCDKGQPCARCVMSDSPEECVYRQTQAGARRDHSADSRGAPGRSAQSSPRIAAALVPGKAGPRLEGVTHWSAIAFEFQEAWPFISGIEPSWEPTYQQIQIHKYLFASLAGFNFPFGGICSFSQNRDQTIQSLPPQQTVNLLIRAYFQTLEPIYRLFHAPQFEEELDAFWIDSSQCSEEWLAQLFMMLVLGYQAAPDHVLVSTEQPMGGWTERFLDAAQFFFSRSPYLSVPTLTSVRTLCLVLIARILELKGAESSQPVSLAGILTRSAMAIHLHRTPSALPGVTRFEAEMRNRIWTTVKLLDLQVTMGTGTTYTHEDHDRALPLNIDNADIYRTQDGWMVDGQWIGPPKITDSTFQIKLAEALPLLIEIINTVNSPTKPPPTYDRVQLWDSRLRQRLRSAESSLSLSPQEAAGPSETTKTQLDFLRLLTHRTLLALHHRHTTTPLFQQHPDSTSAAISSSLDVLRIQQTWRCQPPPLPTAQPRYPPATPIPLSPPQTCLLDLTRDSATAALLHLILSLRRLSRGQIPAKSIPFPPPDQQPPSLSLSLSPSQLLPPHPANPHLPQKKESEQLLTRVIHQSLAAVRSRAGRSAAHFGDYVTVSVAAGCLGALSLPLGVGSESGSESGSGAGFGLRSGSEPGFAEQQQQQQQQRVMDVLLGVAEQIEQTVAGFGGVEGQGQGQGQGQGGFAGW